MFHPMDIVAPIGLGVLASILCGTAFFKTQILPAKIACVLCAIAFTSTIPILYGMRYDAQKHDYKTIFGIKVRQGALNRCEKLLVDNAITWTVGFWKKHFNDNPCVVDAIVDDFIICKDLEKIEIQQYDIEKKEWFWQWVNGYSTWDAAVIGWQSDKRTRSIIIHELSHPILRSCGIMPKDPRMTVTKHHHNYFKKANLGH